jgi:hypothetical protein
MLIYNRKFTMGTGEFTLRMKNLKFVVEMPSGKVLTKFTDKEVAYIKSNPSLFNFFSWYEDKSEEGKQEDKQLQVEDKQDNLILSMIGEEELEVAKPKKSSKKKGGS